MAITVESTTSTNFAAGTTTTINKPTGLSVGDLMIATVGAFAGSSITISTLSGWTLVSTRSIQNGSLSMQYKIADSSDVAASNFTFSCTSASSMCGALMRVTGHAPNSVLDTSDNDVNNAANSATISFTTTISPNSDGNLLVMLLGAGDGNDGGASLSSYTTSDGALSWTEILDTTQDAGTQDPVVGAAYAIQSTATALTSYGATISGSKDDHAGILGCIQVIVDADTTPTFTSSTQSYFAVTESSSTNLLLTLVSSSQSFFPIVGYYNSPPSFTNNQKSSVSFANQNKNTATFTNITKNEPSWTNLSKT